MIKWKKQQIISPKTNLRNKKETMGVREKILVYKVRNMPVFIIDVQIY